MRFGTIYKLYKILKRIGFSDKQIEKILIKKKKR